MYLLKKNPSVLVEASMLYGANYYNLTVLPPGMPDVTFG